MRERLPFVMMSIAVARLPLLPSDTVVPARPVRAAYRAPVGLPRRRDDWRTGAAVSVGVHGLILLLIVAPFAVMQELTLIEQGAGGPGPPGGGGGGTRGSGAVRHESLRYVTVAPVPAPAPVAPAVVPPPQPVLPLPQPALPKIEPPRVADIMPVTGVGGGTGSDGTTGSGPGSGGGVGSGIGTGRGSGTGPGTGGGGAENYPPTPMEMFIPPMPIPGSARGFRVVAQFDVDERGKVHGIEFTPTPDRGYNRRLRDLFGEFRFRPGTRPDGTPVRMKAQLEFILP